MKPGTALAACWAILRRDLTLAWRRRGDMALPVLYAVIVALLFAFALGPDKTLLASIAGGVVLVIVLLAMLLAFDALFRPDLEDGSLEQMLLAPQPLPLLVGMKILAHWLTTADRKSTRLNSSHVANSYAVFCLKKKRVKEKQHEELALVVEEEVVMHE